MGPTGLVPVSPKQTHRHNLAAQRCSSAISIGTLEKFRKIVKIATFLIAIMQFGRTEGPSISANPGLDTG
jgi:hypothetical protein